MSKLTLQIQLKKLGRRKVNKINLLLNKPPKTLKNLIEYCVNSELSISNLNHQLISFLTPESISEKSISGKISFGEIKNKTDVDLAQAINNALQGFNDGLFVVFIDDQEIEKLNDEIDLNNNSTITFMRLTFLTGTYW
jgi:hypothetical protein